SLLCQNINDLASCSKVLPTPDDIIFLDLDPKIALSRKKQDGLSQYEGSNEAEFLKRQNNSQKIWKELQEERWHVLNADQDLDHLQDEIRKVLNL
ncbi:MAG: thymidylate kinase, partial [Thermoproteota archaeon]